MNIIFKFQEENGDYTYMQQIEVPLTHGSLLIMEGATQADWQVSYYSVLLFLVKQSNQSEASTQSQSKLALQVL